MDHPHSLTPPAWRTIVMAILVALLPIFLLLAAAVPLILLLYARIARLQRMLDEARLNIEGANNRLAQAKIQAALLANTDPTTGLLVRQVIVERFQLARAMARRQDTPFGIVLLQLAGFDHLVDRHGQEIGDRILVQVAKRLTTSTREIDTVGRVREHEFAVLLPAMSHGGDIETVVAKLQAVFNPPITLPDRDDTFRLNTVFGWASFPRDGEDWTAILTAADESLARSRTQVAPTPFPHPS